MGYASSYAAALQLMMRADGRSAQAVPGLHLGRHLTNKFRSRDMIVPMTCWQRANAIAQVRRVRSIFLNEKEQGPRLVDVHATRCSNAGIHVHIAACGSSGTHMTAATTTAMDGAGFKG